MVATSSLLLYLSPSHLSPHIPLTGNWELISPHPSLLSLQGWENLLQEESPQPALATCSCPPIYPLRPWSIGSCPSYGQVDPGAVAPAALVSWEGSLPLHPICFVFHFTAV